MASDSMIVALAGGVGGAKLADGLANQRPQQACYFLGESDSGKSRAMRTLVRSGR